MSLPFRDRSIDSAFGRLTLRASESGLTHVLFDVAETPPLDNTIVSANVDAETYLDQAEHELAEYFAGMRTAFTVKLAPSGTDFQKEVWRALLLVSHGTTCTYGDIASRIARPKAVRAVGAANGANPIPVIVPCHRIVGRNRRLVGYAGGLELKRRLLALEGVHCIDDRLVAPNTK